MLCTFTLATSTPRTLVIRSDDIRRIVDIDDLFEQSQSQSGLAYMIGTEVDFAQVLGTAKENMDRLQREELEAIARVNAFQQYQQAQPPIPAGMRPRGKLRT